MEGNDVDELERLRADDQAHMDAELAENNEMLARVREEVRPVCLMPSIPYSVPLLLPMSATHRIREL